MLSGVGGRARPGIVHRLDRDTSGVILVARTVAAHENLAAQFRKRTIKKEYAALVRGNVDKGGEIDEPIGRHPVDRKRMCIRPEGKPAVTRYTVLQRFAAHTYISVSLETGRTHQIRVHFAHRRHALVGDPVYGGRLLIPAGASDELVQMLRGFKRQALHATRLEFIHPDSGEPLSLDAPPPADFEALLVVLREDAK